MPGEHQTFRPSGPIPTFAIFGKNSLDSGARKQWILIKRRLRFMIHSKFNTIGKITNSGLNFIRLLPGAEQSAGGDGGLQESRHQRHG